VTALRTGSWSGFVIASFIPAPIISARNVASIR
jgi:hypothetical protein